MVKGQQKSEMSVQVKAKKNSVPSRAVMRPSIIDDIGGYFRDSLAVSEEGAWEREPWAPKYRRIEEWAKLLGGESRTQRGG